MTPADVKERILSLMGEKHIDYINAKYFLVFDKFTPDCQVLPLFKLSDLITKNPDDSYTRLDVKVLADLNNIVEDFGEPVKIVDTFRYLHMNRSKDEKEAFAHIEGTAIDLRPVNMKLMRELHKSVRKKKSRGRKILTANLVHIDTI